MAVTGATISRAGTGRRSNLLPSGSGDFFRKRLIELAGIALGLIGLAAGLACLSFDPADPSFNQAVDRGPENLLGTPGAYAADLLLQSLGMAAVLVPLLLLGLGWRVARHKSLPRWWLKLALLPLALLLAATALASFAAPEAWPIHGGVGGFVGALLLGWATQSLGAQSWLAATFAAALGGAAFVYVLGLSRAEWRAAGRALFWLAGGARRGLGNLAEAEKNFRAARRARAEEEEEERYEPHLAGAQAEADDALIALARGADEGRDQAPAPGRSRRAAPGKRGRSAEQSHLDLGRTGDYELPGLALLEAPPPSARDAAVNRDSLEKNARLLESVLKDFGVKGEIVKIRPGPVVTRYDLEPAPGTKTSRVVGLADDIARSMSAISVRVAVVPGSNVIGIELPNSRREIVYLRELLGSSQYQRVRGNLPLILGNDISGTPVIVDLVRLPHLLIAGTTGSGKSVSINALILSLLYQMPPEACKFILIDPKMLELSVYEGIPHLISPVVTEPKKAIVALKWVVREMEERYRSMSRLGVRNIEGYNARIEEARKSGEVLTRRIQTGFDPDTGQPVFEEEPFDLEALPFIVVVVDEMADLMLVAGKDIEAAVQRLAQMARAAGIHIIMATQRPSVDVITGTIKANFPTRISFHVTSKIDSRTILGESGAEQLLGQGDMLYMAHGGRITRVHGPLVTDQEVEDVVAYLKRQGQPTYIESVTEDDDFDLDSIESDSGSGDELYDRAVALVCQHRKASTSFVQRHLQIGYNRAARIIEKMEEQGVIGSANHVGKREVLIQGPGAG